MDSYIIKPKEISYRWNNKAIRYIMRTVDHAYKQRFAAGTVVDYYNSNSNYQSSTNDEDGMRKQLMYGSIGNSLPESAVVVCDTGNFIFGREIKADGELRGRIKCLNVRTANIYKVNDFFLSMIMMGKDADEALNEYLTRIRTNYRRYKDIDLEYLIPEHNNKEAFLKAMRFACLNKTSLYAREHYNDNFDIDHRAKSTNTSFKQLIEFKITNVELNTKRTVSEYITSNDPAARFNSGKYVDRQIDCSMIHYSIPNLCRTGYFYIDDHAGNEYFTKYVYKDNFLKNIEPATATVDTKSKNNSRHKLENLVVDKSKLMCLRYDRDLDLPELEIAMNRIRNLEYKVGDVVFCGYDKTRQPMDNQRYVIGLVTDSGIPVARQILTTGGFSKRPDFSMFLKDYIYLKDPLSPTVEAGVNNTIREHKEAAKAKKKLRTDSIKQ